MHAGAGDGRGAGLQDRRTSEEERMPPKVTIYTNVG